eukprot:CAMPEP_0197402912 /NCGR_PEP_ID=MMETSP1165-20131217/20783_1 /TAXON_ID=284809 /ORGANISM="Chrysocystis fragilis, Strain CCMP3189" /LENGTH=68 /DNA_ID=CAMNT_0042929097 /DNA_START=32 /DNA_END=234 /DNA_ORIENTATION=+
MSSPARRDLSAVKAVLRRSGTPTRSPAARRSEPVGLDLPPPPSRDYAVAEAVPPPPYTERDESSPGGA